YALHGPPLRCAGGPQMVVTSVAKSDLGRSVAHALRDILEGKPAEVAMRVVTSALRNTAYSLAQFLEDCASAKDEIVRQIDNPDQALKAWEIIDSAVAAALRETSCIHEAVLKT